ncbi:hypothetical protein AGLY_012613 [Aphis glycines]|uniref:Uncharacterized protein n=1 Tax=Aphis glycines TaxID=307491 RepID=A0A6G0T8U0_APHGL|nr:hypothetical protein AGLY_012613 [Aphis glycines]
MSILEIFTNVHISVIYKHVDKKIFGKTLKQVALIVVKKKNQKSVESLNFYETCQNCQNAKQFNTKFFISFPSKAKAKIRSLIMEKCYERLNFKLLRLPHKELRVDNTRFFISLTYNNYKKRSLKLKPPFSPSNLNYNIFNKLYPRLTNHLRSKSFFGSHTAPNVQQSGTHLTTLFFLLAKLEAATISLLPTHIFFTYLFHCHPYKIQTQSLDYYFSMIYFIILENKCIVVLQRAYIKILLGLCRYYRITDEMLINLSSAMLGGGENPSFFEVRQVYAKARPFSLFSPTRVEKERSLADVKKTFLLTDWNLFETCGFVKKNNIFNPYFDKIWLTHMYNTLINQFSGMYRLPNIFNPPPPSPLFKKNA